MKPCPRDFWVLPHRYVGLAITQPARAIIFFPNLNHGSSIPMMFYIVLEQAEDSWIVAECPALPGCVSQGKDEQEALENIKEAKKAMSALKQTPTRPPVMVAV